MNSISHIVTDIEGTTTDIRFVHKVLFPYSREHLAEFLNRNWQDPRVVAAVKQVEELAALEGKPADSREAIIAHLRRWIDEDRKVGPLKTLQGFIWKEGFLSGEFKGHVYEDVPDCLKRWSGPRGVSLGIYSSGSVEAQKLLFSHTEFGDLTPFFSNFFDTGVGQKREVTSYQRILTHLGGAPAEAVLFLSDIAEELDAALSAGMLVCQLVRPGTSPSNRHPMATSFLEIDQTYFS